MERCMHPSTRQPHSALPWTLVNLTMPQSGFVNTGSNKHPQLTHFSHLDGKLSTGNVAGCPVPRQSGPGTSSHGYSLMPPQKRPSRFSRQKHPENY